MLSAVLAFIGGLQFGSANVALHKPAYSSSVYPLVVYNHDNVVAGGRGDILRDGVCWRSNHYDMLPWFTVDLLDTYVITNITITNRGDNLIERLHDIRIELFDVNPVRCPSAVGQFCLEHNDILLGTETLTCDTKVVGRFLRVTKVSMVSISDTLILCEVEVQAEKEFGSANVALHKPAYSSSVYPLVVYNHDNVVAGGRGDILRDGVCWRSNHYDMLPWFTVDLLDTYVITNITITNRGDNLIERLHDIRIELFDVNPVRCPSAVGQFCLEHNDILLGTETLTCDTKVVGRFLRVTKVSMVSISDTLILCEVEVQAEKETNCRPMKYPRVAGFELNQQDPQTPMFLPRIKCASDCAMTTFCVGFNYIPTSGSCQLIVRPTSNATANPSAGVDYYGFDLC